MEIAAGRGERDAGQEDRQVREGDGIQRQVIGKRWSVIGSGAERGEDGGRRRQDGLAVQNGDLLARAGVERKHGRARAGTDDDQVVFIRHSG